MSYEFVTDQVWERIHPLLSDANSFGRPRCNDRDVLEGILWVLKTGARWSARLGAMLHGRQLRAGQKRGLCVGKAKKGKGTKWMVVADGKGLPVGGTLFSASPAEVTLAIPTLADCKVRTGRFLRRLIVDRAYDADSLRHLMTNLDGEQICPIAGAASDHLPSRRTGIVPLQAPLEG